MKKKSEPITNSILRIGNKSFILNEDPKPTCTVEEENIGGFRGFASYRWQPITLTLVNKKSLPEVKNLLGEEREFIISKEGMEDVVVHHGLITEEKQGEYLIVDVQWAKIMRDNREYSYE